MEDKLDVDQNQEHEYLLFQEMGLGRSIDVIMNVC
jgi:hypothetical protein